MTKKGPLSKAEKFYIENNRGLSIIDLCKDLDRAQSIVNKFVKTLPEPEEKKDTLLFQQFAKNDKGSVVMSENASEMADSKRVSFSQKKRPSCVTETRKG